MFDLGTMLDHERPLLHPSGAYLSFTQAGADRLA